MKRHRDALAAGETDPRRRCRMYIPAMMRMAVAIVPEVRQLLAETPPDVEALRSLLEEMHDEDTADLINLLQDDEAAKFLLSLKAEDAAPIFERAADGTVKARLALSEIFAGYELRGERMDNQTAAALSAVQSVFDRPELRVELDFAPGQIQYVNNRATGHARTDFVDHPEPERRRHLVRLWLRDSGRRGYRG